MRVRRSGIGTRLYNICDTSTPPLYIKTLICVLPVVKEVEETNTVLVCEVREVHNCVSNVELMMGRREGVTDETP